MIEISRSTAVFSAFALLGLIAIGIASGAGSWIGISKYAGYPSFFVFLCLGIMRPRQGYLLALILLPFELKVPAPHSITSSPSSYLISGSLIGLLILPGGVRALAGNRIPFNIASVVIFAATAGLLTAAIRTENISFKLATAEFLGLVSMTFFVLVPSVLLRSGAHVDQALRALSLSTFVVLAGGVVGAFTTITCIPGEESLWPFVSAGHRASGFAADPNQLGLSCAGTLALLVSSRDLTFSGKLRALGVAAVALVTILTGSRTGIIAGLVIAIILLVVMLIDRERLGICLAGLAITILLSGPLAFWAHLPCPMTRPWHMVTYAERNDFPAYWFRQVERERYNEIRTSPASTQVSPMYDGLRDVVTLDNTRRILWQDSISKGSDFMPFGAGLGSMSTQMTNGWRSHNTALTIFFELGFVGLVALALVKGTCIAGSVKILARARSSGTSKYVALVAMLAVYALGSLSQDMHRSEYLWGLIGLVIIVGICRVTGASELPTSSNILHDPTKPEIST